MTAASEIITTLTARAKEITDWDFQVRHGFDEDGDGYIDLIVTYPDQAEGFDPATPWDAFGMKDYLMAHTYGAYPDRDDSGNIIDCITFTVFDGEVD